MNTELSPDIQKANRSFRGKGAVGKNAIIPKYVAELFDKTFQILDYGCGPAKIHIENLKLLGFASIDGFDFGKNWRENMQYEVKSGHYDVIYASNVVNTWSTIELSEVSLDGIHNGLKPNGIFLSNLPKTPRYLLNNSEYEKLLELNFSIRHLEANVYFCTKK